MKTKLISTSTLLFTLLAPAMVLAQNTFPATGNVGIGTTTPSEKLDVKGNIRLNDNTLYLRGAGDNNHGIAYRGVNPFAGQTIDGPVAFGWTGGVLGTTGGGEKIALRWIQNGNVGIGVNAPAEKLTVSGNIAINAPTGAQALTITQNSIDTRDPSGRTGGLQLNFNTGEPVMIGNWTIPNNNNMSLRVGGSVIIGYRSILTGDLNADYKLSVDGKIVAKSVYVTMTGWGDFVFDKNYQRMSWLQKKNFLETNRHLPGLEKASDIEKNGVNMSETLKNVTINVEENSLDIIDLYQRLEKLELENTQLKKELTSFKNKAGR
jgi:hypothetical protein